MTRQSSDGRPQAISVLLVEDDAPTRWRLHDALAAAQFEVTSAATLSEARAALATADRPAPRVLLTDLQLPDGHGTELIREVRHRFPETEIMVVSILGDEESVISAITVGATGYLLKDAVPTDIAATVRRPLADLGVDRSLHRTPDAGPRNGSSTNQSAAAACAQYCKAHAARD
jgi:DNA-binding NarL/FixJ family response regulator